MGLTIPEMTLCTTNGFILVRCLSSKDSRTTKRGKDEIEVSLSESLSGQSRLDIFEEAIELLKFSSDVLPTHPGALQGDVLRGKPIRLSNTRATHLRYASLGMFYLKCKKFCQSTQVIK